MREFGIVPQEAPTIPSDVPTIQLVSEPDLEPASPLTPQTRLEVSTSSSRLSKPTVADTAPAILYSNPSDPAPPYAAVAQVGQESNPSVINNFFFSMTPDGSRRICGRFGPALTAMLMSLNVNSTICVHEGYSEDDMPDVLHVCGVLELHIPYLLLLINAERALPVML